MGMQTTATVEIAKPAAEVFSWLVEPQKLTAWAGSRGAMPDDPSVLKVGYEGAGPVAGIAGGEARMTVQAWDPPHGFGARMTYAGGDATTTYALTEAGGTTTLTVSSDTDWATPDLSAAEKQVAAFGAEALTAMHHAIDMMNQQIASGAHDAATQGMMQSALEQSLQKLKGLVEAA